MRIIQIIKKLLARIEDIRMGAFALPKPRAKVRYSHAGFSFLETIVAIGIILVGLVGVIILMGQSIRSIRVAGDRIVATQLAQEAIEVVVNIRDTNWLSSQPWRTNIPSTSQGIVDYNSTQVFETINTENYCLSLIGDIYTHQTPPCNTQFKRHVEIIDKTEIIGVTSVDFIEVRGIVEWSDGTLTKSVNIVNHLYDWN